MSAPAVQPQIKPFDLRQRVLEVVEASDTADPHALTEEVLSRISTRDAPNALAQCLPGYVRLIVAGLGRENVRRTADSKPRSWKLEGARLLMERTLRRRVMCGDTWKLLAECTKDDVLSIAGARRQQAADLIAHAVWYERLADAMGDAETVADVPEGTFLELVTNSGAES